MLYLDNVFLLFSPKSIVNSASGILLSHSLVIISSISYILTCPASLAVPSFNLAPIATIVPSEFNDTE